MNPSPAGSLQGAAAHIPLTTHWVLRGGLFILALIFVRLNSAGGDWAPIWAAGQLALTDPSSVYDFNAVSLLQHPFVGDLGQRPFVYPPTTLLIAAPISLLPFWLSFFLYAATSLYVVARASKHWSADRWLLIASPPIVASVYYGQPTLFVAALILYGLARLDDRPATAGALLGLAAVLKPQLLVLAPIALIAGQHWRAILTASLAAAAAIVMTILMFGVELWWRWIEALPRFQAFIAGYEPFLRNSLSPHAAAIRWGIEPWGITVFMLIVAIVAVALVFARTPTLSCRLVALVGGALLISPYAMNYELAVLAPAVLASRIDHPRDLLLPFIWAVSMVVSLSMIGLLAVYFLMLVSATTGISATYQTRMKRRVDVAA